MATSSRRLAARFKNQRPSHTRGKDKAETCQKSDLKTWGMNANPNKLGNAGQSRYRQYCDHVDSMKNNK